LTFFFLKKKKKKIRILYLQQFRGETFVIPEDDESYLCEAEEQAYAYVYFLSFFLSFFSFFSFQKKKFIYKVRHVTLFDIYARGFVRPLCLSYVTTETQKIMGHFEELSSEIGKAAEYLKMENQCFFLQDLEKRYIDLIHTKAYLESDSNSDLTYSDTNSDSNLDDDSNSNNDRGYSAISLENIDNFINDTKKMIQSLKTKISKEKIAHDRIATRSFSGFFSLFSLFFLDTLTLS